MKRLLCWQRRLECCSRWQIVLSVLQLPVQLCDTAWRKRWHHWPATSRWEILQGLFDLETCLEKRQDKNTTSVACAVWSLFMLILKFVIWAGIFCCVEACVARANLLPSPWVTANGRLFYFCVLLVSFEDWLDPLNGAFSPYVSSKVAKSFEQDSGGGESSFASSSSRGSYLSLILLLKFSFTSWRLLSCHFCDTCVERGGFWKAGHSLIFFISFWVSSVVTSVTRVLTEETCDTSQVPRASQYPPQSWCLTSQQDQLQGSYGYSAEWRGKIRHCCKILRTIASFGSVRLTWLWLKTHPVFPENQIFFKLCQWFNLTIRETAQFQSDSACLFHWVVLDSNKLDGCGPGPDELFLCSWTRVIWLGINSQENHWISLVDLPSEVQQGECWGDEQTGHEVPGFHCIYFAAIGRESRRAPLHSWGVHLPLISHLSFVWSWFWGLFFRYRVSLELTEEACDTRQVHRVSRYRPHAERVTSQRETPEVRGVTCDDKFG